MISAFITATVAVRNVNWNSEILMGNSLTNIAAPKVLVDFNAPIN